MVSTFFLSRLKEKMPDSTLVVAAPSPLQDLFSSHPSVSQFIPLPYREGGDFREAARRIREARFDQAYILPRSFRSALESWWARVPRRIGFSGDLRRLLLTEVHRYDEKLSYPHRYLKLIGDETLDLRTLRPFFPKANLNLEEVAQRLGFSASALRQPVLGIGPASVAPSRTWPVEHYAAVAKRFIEEKNGTVVLFGSPSETPLTKSIRDTIGDRVIDTAGRLNLPMLGWFMSQCQAYLGNDSGLMHVASAFEIPSLILFGPSDPAVALPATGRFTAIQHPEIECVPCLRNHCVRMGEHYLACLRAIEAEEVSQKVNGLLRA